MIRIVTYNVNGALDTGAVATVLATLQPDIVCLLEAPSRFPLRRVAKGAGLTVVERAGRRRLSTAILVGEETRVLSHDHFELSAPPGVPARHLAHAIVGVGGHRLSVAATQFGMRPELREENVVEVERILDAVDLPTVLGVDLNESPGGAVAGRLAARLQDAFAVAGTGRGETYPTPDPSTRQDFCFVDPSLAIEQTHVPTEPPVDVASHHRPVVVDLAGPEATGDRIPTEVTELEPVPDEPEADPDAAEPAA
ncbi:MAG: hypothetical protein KY457_11770 [Actinobacteria bacterium]|nr:hypothetical protein [Actinomycetota bacterium]